MGLIIACFKRRKSSESCAFGTRKYPSSRRYSAFEVGFTVEDSRQQWTLIADIIELFVKQRCSGRIGAGVRGVVGDVADNLNSLCKIASTWDL